MALRNLLTISMLIASARSTSPVQVPITEASSFHGPSVQYAKENAIHVFNALHASMRQWDSSLKHNGMSFFCASIPNNTLLYHGTGSDKAIEGTEWLAFEIEHAEVFAGPRGPHGGGPGRGPPGGRRPGDGDRGRGPPPDNGSGTSRDREGEEFGPRNSLNDIATEGSGYLHIYKTKKPLTKLLYLDGMSAGKTSMGTLDTQDRIFLNSSAKPLDPPRRGGPMSDYQRAEAMCNLSTEYGIEGIIRMEAGFELILCNFSTSVSLVSAFERPKYGTDEGINDLRQFEYVRGIGYRYNGITAQRVTVDYSYMVSAYFYPLNLTNPDASRPELPRLPADDKAGLAALKSDVLRLFSDSKAQSNAGIDWQGVVDMIITRYSDRLQYMVSNISTQQTILSEINFLLSVFVNYKDVDINASVAKCTNHYLLPISPVTTSDGFIYAAILAVSEKICSTLFDVRAILLKDGGKGTSVAEPAKKKIAGLIEYLDWSDWKSCGKCAYDEVCFVAIWPWGGVEDHLSPGCVKNDQMAGRIGYWDFGP